LESPYDSELLATSPPKRRLFAYKWAEGYISPFRPTSDDVIVEILKTLQPSPLDLVVDCGCGDGRVLIAIAKKCGCKCVGLDLDEDLLENARKEAANENVSELVLFKKQDLLDESVDLELRNGTIIFLYLLPAALGKFKRFLLPHLERGVVVVSVRWQIDGWDCYIVNQSELQFKGFHVYKSSVKSTVTLNL